MKPFMGKAAPAFHLRKVYDTLDRLVMGRSGLSESGTALSPGADGNGKAPVHGQQTVQYGAYLNFCVNGRVPLERHQFLSKLNGNWYNAFPHSLTSIINFFGV